MRSLNSVFLIGTLTQASLHNVAGVTPRLDLNLAGNDNVVGDDGHRRDLAWYHRATLFGHAALEFAPKAVVGHAFFVEGGLYYRSWTEDEVAKYSLSVRAERVEAVAFDGDETSATVTDRKGQLRLQDASNEVRLIGLVTRDATVRNPESVTAVTRLNVVINEQYRTRAGLQTRPHFVGVNAWRELALRCGELRRGEPVLVTGRLVNDAWTDPGGATRYATRVEAQQVKFLGTRHLPHAPRPGGRVVTQQGLNASA